MIAALKLPRIGKVTLRDFLGNSYQAEVVTLQMKLADADTFVPVVCAVCDRLSNDVLLGTDVIDRLNRVWLSEQTPVHDDVCDVGMSGDVNIDMSRPGKFVKSNTICKFLTKLSFIHKHKMSIYNTQKHSDIYIQTRNKRTPEKYKSHGSRCGLITKRKRLKTQLKYSKV